jgi:hypothetical protein
MILLPRNRHVNLLDSIHDYCYPKTLEKRFPITQLLILNEYSSKGD